MSWATMRTRSPARLTLPSSTAATSSWAAISRRLCSRFFSGITDVLEITLRARIFESWAMTSSVIPLAKYSFSGSGLRLAKGSTAMERGRRGTAAGWVSASANAAAVPNRSAGSAASAFRSACSTPAGTVARSRRTPGTCVRVVEGRGGVPSDADRLLDRKQLLAVEPLAQGFARDVGHHVEEEPVRFARVVQRQDVGVIQLGGDLDLAEKPFGPDGGRQLGPEDLDRDLAAVLQVVG